MRRRWRLRRDMIDQQCPRNPLAITDDVSDFATAVKLIRKFENLTNRSSEIQASLTRHATTMCRLCEVLNPQQEEADDFAELGK